MSFYLRKAIKVGPVRFNLSKGGIGVSAGVRGLRVGTGPHGNYVHIGRHGLYYRHTLPSRPSQQTVYQGHTTTPPPPPPSSPQQSPIAPEPDVSGMRDSTSEALLDELRQKQNRTRLQPFVLILAALILLVALGSGSVPLLVIVISASILAAWWARRRDELAKTTVLMYDLDAEHESRYQALHEGFNALRACAARWLIAGSHDVTDVKRNAGARRVLNRQKIVLPLASPPWVKTNIQIPALPSGSQTLYFLPDRVLVYKGHDVGAVPYSATAVARTGTRFIESGSVPPDAKVVDHTWQYLNKSGGPDKRFNNNRQLPVMLYEAIAISADKQLTVLLEASRLEAGQQLEEAIRQLRTSPASPTDPAVNPT